MTEPVRPPGFTAAGLRRGARAALALTIALLPFGLVVGAAAAGRGLTFAETVLMSALVFAGTAQLVALELWTDPAPILAATLAALTINLRMAPQGAALAPLLDRVRGVRLWGTLALLVDNAFALTIAELRAGRRDVGFLAGAAATMWVNWVLATAAGHALAGLVQLPPGHPIFFASAATLLALLVPIWRGRGDLLPWAVAGVAALLAHGAGLGAPWPVLLGAFAGAAAGAAVERRAAAAATERRA